MTSEYVLKRDGTNVVVDSACAATSGTWFSPYDGATWTAASDVDIDHMVPLKNAWISGANTWTAAKRTVGQARDAWKEYKGGLTLLAALGIRERYQQPAAVGRDGQRQPVQGRQVSRCLEASSCVLLLHLRQELGVCQNYLCAEHHLG